MNVRRLAVVPVALAAAWLAGCSSSGSSVGPKGGDGGVVDARADRAVEASVRCVIGGKSYPSGEVNPANACEKCEPGDTATAWSVTAEGASCDTGSVCHSGTCVAGCVVEGAYYGPDAVNPKSACQMCQPAKATGSWTSLADGTSCGAGQTCSAGSCALPCHIDGQAVASGALNPANACQACLPTSSATSWSDLTAGTSCGAGMVCVTGACTAGCYIGKQLEQASVANPTDPCEYCDPAQSTSAWAAVANGKPCAEGKICFGGVCAAACSIGSSVQLSGTPDPANACARCLADASTTAWTPVTNGTACDGGTCQSGACEEGVTDGGSGSDAATQDAAPDAEAAAPADASDAATPQDAAAVDALAKEPGN